MWIIIAAVVIILGGGIAAMLKVTMPIAKNVYMTQLVKTEPSKWGRECSAPENEEQIAMWNEGIEWAKENEEYKKEVMIENDGLKLYGEYYDFGYDRVAIILPGRCECLMYSYYFASPYKDGGCNVLVIDSRCHGKSDGKYSTIGAKEAEDVLKWIKFLQENFIVKEVYFHGVCIGSAAGIYAMENPACPDIVKGMVTEGCFTNFRETFKQHMIVDNRPLFPVLDLVMWNIKKYTGVDVIKQSPINSMKNMNKRMLFLFGEKDVFSIPPKSKQLFEACASEDKKLVWFDKGGHSHLRINNKEKYDREVVEFLQYEEK